MSFELSTSQINKLGERLRKGKVLPGDQEMLAAFLRSFGDARKLVIDRLVSLDLKPGEREKTAYSLVQKLQRESIRLSKLQDVAGCRVIVENIADQDRLTYRILEAFPDAKSVDRRKQPMHGYRAVHIIVEVGGKAVEIQVRTELQHLWAQWSETLATVLGQEIKYGGGAEEIRRRLTVESLAIAQIEEKHHKVNAEIALSLESLSRSSHAELSNVVKSISDSVDLIAGELEVVSRLNREIMKLQRMEKNSGLPY